MNPCDWRPIETAPKDDHVIVYQPPVRYVDGQEYLRYITTAEHVG